MLSAVMNWSGGKDSALCLFKVLLSKEYNVHSLLTSVNKEYKRISMHGVREELLDMQAKEIGIPLDKIYMPENASMEIYERILTEQLKQYRTHKITHSIFGDIFLEDLRQYREKQLEPTGMKAVFPLWKSKTTELVREFIALGFKSIITAVDERYLDETFVGRIINLDFLNDLPANVDPCGENGEFHSFVFDGPVFNNPLKFEVGEKTYKQYPSHHKDEKDQFNGFWFIDLIV